MTDSDIRNLAKQFAEGFQSDAGDTILEYSERVAWDVYPTTGLIFRKGVSPSTVNAERREFKILVQGFIRDINRDSACI